MALNSSAACILQTPQKLLCKTQLPQNNYFSHGHLIYRTDEFSPASFQLKIYLNQSSSRILGVNAMKSSAKEYTDSTKEKGEPFGVLFVCLGNICRSPTAEAVFTYLVESRGLTKRFKIDSAGTYGYHEGEPADGRMRQAAQKRGIKLTSISRPIRRSDFEDFDLILAMDRKNYADILAAFENWNSKRPLPPESQNKVQLMCSYCKKFNVEEVPDPYYGGPAGFEKVLDLLEDACGNMLATLESQLKV